MLETIYAAQPHLQIGRTLTDVVRHTASIIDATIVPVPADETQTETFLGILQNVQAMQSLIPELFGVPAKDKGRAVNDHVGTLNNIFLTTVDSSEPVFTRLKRIMELIDANSLDYFIQSDFLDEDINIKFFGDADSEGLIGSIGINSNVTPPPKGASIVIGNRCFAIDLEESGVMSKSLDSVGSSVNTSLVLSDQEVFTNQKFFFEDYNIRKNISKLRRVGDYSVDYRRGVIYVNVDRYRSIDDIGFASYNSMTIRTYNKNILDVSELCKKLRSSDSAQRDGVVYNLFEFEHDSITPLNLESSIIFQKDSGEELAISKDYTIALPDSPTAIEGVYTYDSLFGANLDSPIKNDRVPDMGAKKLNINSSSGGGNFYDSKYMKLYKNIIDLKSVVKRRFSENKNGDLEIFISDKNISKIYSAVRDKNGEELFGESKVVEKLDVDVSSKIIVDDCLELGIKTGVDLSKINLDSDFIVDSSGQAFKIKSFNNQLSTVTIDASYNDFSIGIARIGSMVELAVDNAGLRIIVPRGSAIYPGDIITISYIKNNIPSPGQRVAVNYRYGKVFLTYSYVRDDLFISYEYGDNQLDWSISSTLVEGEDYYVDYKYGASREALKDNFGKLTNIEFFNRAPLNIDREVYRSALLGTMSAFTSGPTIESFEKLGSTFTGIKPDINESFFGSWILGRDHLDHKSVDHSGVLNFLPGKFDSGLYFTDGVGANIPAESNISIEEGTISAWTKPFWSGLANDADITFNINNLDAKRFKYNNSMPLFSKHNAYSVFESDESIGGTDETGGSVSIFNHRNVGDENRTGIFGIFREDSQLDRFNRSKFSLDFMVKSFSAPNESIGNKFCNPGFISIGDGNKCLASLFSIDTLKTGGNDYNLMVSDKNLKFDIMPDYDMKNPSRNCYCSILDNLDSLLDFDSNCFLTNGMAFS